MNIEIPILSVKFQVIANTTGANPITTIAIYGIGISLSVRVIEDSPSLDIFF